MNIFEGTKGNPLGHFQLAYVTSAENGSSSKQAESRKGYTSMGAIVLLVGIIGLVAVIAVVTVFAVARSRRNSVNGIPASETYPQNLGYPPQQAMPPTTQFPYSAPVANQPSGYPAPPVQPPQHPNPYTQQPPYGQ